MDDIDWMDVKEKDDTIRELRQKLAEANKRIAELEATLDSIRHDPNWIVDLSYDEGVE